MENNTTKRYEIVPALQWYNHLTGATVSIYGACPYHSDVEKMQWKIRQNGWTIRDNKTNTIGMGRPPFVFRHEAEKFLSILEEKTK